MRLLGIKMVVVILGLSYLSGCADMVENLFGNRFVRRTSEAPKEEIRWLKLEDEKCQQSGTPVNLETATIYVWNGSGAVPTTVPFKGRPYNDGRLISENVYGSVLGSQWAESCSVNASQDINCRPVKTGKETGNGFVKICRTNGTYKRDSLEAMTLTIQYFVEENFKFYNSVINKKEGLHGLFLLTQVARQQDYSFANGEKRTVFSADNAAFYPGDEAATADYLMLLPTSNEIFQITAHNLWEVPFVLRHEFAHHVLNFYLTPSQTNVVPQKPNLTPHIHVSEHNHSILPTGRGRPSGLALTSDDIVNQALGGIHEAFADIYAYFQGGGIAGQIQGEMCMSISRDPSSPIIRNGDRKGLTPARIDMYEGRAAPLPFTNCYEPTFDDVHDIATVLGYPLAQFIKDANPGADAAGQTKVLLMWASRISSLYTINYRSVSIDTLVKELILTLKTDMNKDIASACTTLNTYITGLPQATASCR